MSITPGSRCHVNHGFTFTPPGAKPSSPPVHPPTTEDAPSGSNEKALAKLRLRLLH